MNWMGRSTASIDPAEFSWDEFPIHCQQCGYQLHAVNHGRCPECNTAFERGRMLYEQYFLKVSFRKDQLNRTPHVLGVIGVVIFVVSLIGIFLTPRFNADALTNLFMSAFCVGVALLGLMAFWILLYEAIASNPPILGFKAKRRRIKAWLNEHRPWEG